MIRKLSARLLQFLLLTVLQVFVCDQIHLFGYATPLVYVAFILYTPLGASRTETLLWAFLMGITMDTFSNTPGVAASSMTFLGLLQPPMLQLMMTKETPDGFIPSARSLGHWRYFLYALILASLHVFICCAIEYFTFHGDMEILYTILGSTLLTVMVIMLMEEFRG